MLNNFVGKKIHFAITDSTMNVAKSIITGQEITGNISQITDVQFPLSDIISDQTIILADAQISGRGRLARKWESDSGRGLYVTYLFSLKNGQNDLSGFSLAAGVAIKRAIAQLRLNVNLKWPNDIVVLDDHNEMGKLGGILIDLDIEDSLLFVSVGIGVNLRKIDCENTMYKITSLEELGVNITAEELLEKLNDEFWNVCEIYFQNGFIALKDEWLNCCLGLDYEVKVIVNEQEIFGKMVGVSNSGQLLLEDKNGEITEFTVGDVSLLMNN